MVRQDDSASIAATGGNDVHDLAGVVDYYWIEAVDGLAGEAHSQRGSMPAVFLHVVVTTDGGRHADGVVIILCLAETSPIDSDCEQASDDG